MYSTCVPLWQRTLAKTVSGYDAQVLWSAVGVERMAKAQLDAVEQHMAACASRQVASALMAQGAVPPGLQAVQGVWGLLLANPLLSPPRT